MIIIIIKWRVSLFITFIETCLGVRPVINVVTSMEVGPLFQALKFVRLNHRYNREKGFSDFRKILMEVLSGTPLELSKEGCCMQALCDVLMDHTQDALRGGYGHEYLDFHTINKARARLFLLYNLPLNRFAPDATH